MNFDYNDDPFANPGEPKRGQCVLFRNVWFKPEDFPVDEILDELQAFGVNQKALEVICRRSKARSMYIKGMTATDLAPMAELNRLKSLRIYWANKFSDASAIGTLKGLKSLMISDTMRWHDLSNLEGLNVTDLELSGGMNNESKYETLAPLSTLGNLETLNLTHFKVSSGGLRPLAKCSSLKELTLDCRFPTEDYAYLSVHLPKVKCDAFSPFIKLEGRGIGGKDVLVVGSRKPYLHSGKDATRLAKYVAKFEAMQEEFRCELHGD